MSGRLTVPPRDRRRKTPPGHSAMVRAWVALAFYPISFVAAFVVGEGLLSWYGYSDQGAPLWAAAAAAGPALLIFVIPGVFAVVYGLRAVRQGNREGQTPALVGAAVGVGMIALNVVTGVIAALT
ncbi:MAG TPA: hypothetical protein VG497_31700 [Kribbella sp.]|nr:hypothetical protein [Kribbella sp.]